MAQAESVARRCFPVLERLRKRFIVASLSNGNVALLVNMARHGGYCWDCVLSAELARHYKPDPEVYQTAAGLLGLELLRSDDGRRAQR